MPKPPRIFSAAARVAGTDNPLAGLEHEFVAESASNLGDLGRRLAAAVSELESFDAAHPRESLDTAGRSARERLVAETGELLWRFVVQREACGLRDSERVMRDYRITAELRFRMGVRPAPKA